MRGRRAARFRWRIAPSFAPIAVADPEHVAAGDWNVDGFGRCGAIVVGAGGDRQKPALAALAPFGRPTGSRQAPSARPFAYFSAGPSANNSRGRRPDARLRSRGIRERRLRAVNAREIHATARKNKATDWQRLITPPYSRGHDENSNSRRIDDGAENVVSEIFLCPYRGSGPRPGRPPQAARGRRLARGRFGENSNG